MTFLGFLKDFIIRPGKAMEENVGKYTLVGFLIPFSTAFIIGLSAILFFTGYQSSMLIFRLTILSLFNTIIGTLFIHVPAYFMTEKKKSIFETWKDYISLAGFTYIIQAIGLLFITVYGLLTLKVHTNNTFTWFNKGFLLVILISYVIMWLIPFIYKAIIIKFVYNAGWGKVVGILIVSLLLTGIIKIDIPIVNVANRTQVDIFNMPLMLDGIEEIDVPYQLTSTVAFDTSVDLKNDSIILLNPMELYARSPKSRKEITSSFLAYLAAIPGDEIYIDEGRVFVNGEEKYTPTIAIPNLSMNSRKLLEDEYFIYFNSPQALIVSTKAEDLIVSKDFIQGVVLGNHLRTLRWLLK